MLEAQTTTISKTPEDHESGTCVSQCTIRANLHMVIRSNHEAIRRQMDESNAKDVLLSVYQAALHDAVSSGVLPGHVERVVQSITIDPRGPERGILAMMRKNRELNEEITRLKGLLDAGSL